MNAASSLEALVVERFPVLAGLPPQALRELVAASALREVPAGTVLFEPGARRFAASSSTCTVPDWPR